jgi:FtsH-binding integral membrane protein
LRQDERLAAEAPRQAGIRRIYLYLVAGIGLAALLIGLGGVISVFLRLIDQSLGSDLREQLAWFSAAVLAGLPVWFWNWRRAQQLALALDIAGETERTALTRKIYLYFYIFAATMTILSSLVYIASKIFGLLLGEPAPTLSQLGQAIAFSLIAVGVWLYHGASLRSDSRLSQNKRQARLQEINVLILDSQPAGLAAALLPALQRALPGVHGSVLTASVPVEGQPSPGEQLAPAGLIIAPWTAVMDSEAAFGWAAALRNSSAPKLLLPLHAEGWIFAGVDRHETSALIDQTVHAVGQILAGQEVRPNRPLGVGAVIGIIIAGLIGLTVLMSILSMVIENF